MNFKISQMAALALLEHTALDASLVEQINSAPAKADILYLSAPKELLQNARDELRVYIESIKPNNPDAYSKILKEIEYLAE